MIEHSIVLEKSFKGILFISSVNRKVTRGRNGVYEENSITNNISYKNSSKIASLLLFSCDMRHFTIQIQDETLLPKLDEPCISFEEQKKSFPVA